MAQLRAGDVIGDLPLRRAAEGLERDIGLAQLLFQLRPLHGEEGPARLHIGQAQLAQDVEARDRPGRGEIEALPESVGHFLGAGVDKLHIGKAQLFAAVLQEREALVKTVEQRELQLRAENLEHEAREARAGAHVDERPAGELPRLQKGGAVQKMQARHIRLPADGGEVHDPIPLFEIFKIDAKAAQGLLPGGIAPGLKPPAQDLFQCLRHVPLPCRYSNCGGRSF